MPRRAAHSSLYGIPSLVFTSSFCQSISNSSSISDHNLSIDIAAETDLNSRWLDKQHIVCWPVAAMKSFQPNCTLPPPGPGFVASPNMRSTLDIVWSCLSVILLSTWSVLHLNVPPQFDSRTWQQRLWKELWLTWRKVKWMLWALLAPELLLAKALDRYLSARGSVRAMKDLAEEDGTQWTLTHAFFADMGGFMVVFPDVAASGTLAMSKVPAVLAEPQEKQVQRYRRMGPFRWRPHATHCELAAQVNVGDTEDDLLGLLRLCGNIWVLDARQMESVRRYGIISHLPRDSEAELNDKSKSDGLVKFIALVQLLWLVLQLIARAAQGQPSSQLEIMALAYAVCAVVIYGLSWFTPKDVSQPVVLQAARSPSQAEMETVQKVSILSAPLAMPGHYALPNSALLRSGSPIGWQIGFLFGAVAFGLVHLAAWNFEFPTSVEQWLWRAFSLTLTGSPAILLVMAWLNTRVEAPWMLEVASIGGFLIAVSRLFLLVETLRSLYFMEPAAYTTTTWVVGIPHVG